MKSRETSIYLVLGIILLALGLAACGPAQDTELESATATARAEGEPAEEPQRDQEDESESADQVAESGDFDVYAGLGEAGFETTASGLQFAILEKGDGEQPQLGQEVTVHYTGWLEDGSSFDSSVERGQPFSFPLGLGSVIAGWDEGIALLNVGDKARLVIPGELAYGEAGRPGIPPDATLIFDVELLGVADSAAAAPPAPEPDPNFEVYAGLGEDGFETTKSGLQYAILEEGDGEQPDEGQVVTVHYTGWLEDGTSFDSSVDRGQPFTFPLGLQQVIAGWDEGIALLHVGDKARLVIPSELAYGEAGRPGIPPNAMLVFDVELLEVAEGAPESPVAIDPDDYVVTDSGLQYHDMTVGDGPALEEGQVATMHFTAWLEDGTLIDSSLNSGQPLQMLVGGGQNIPGWEEGLMTMNVGGVRQLVIPSDLAFGEEGAGNGFIPPNATLILELEVIDVQDLSQ